MKHISNLGLVILAGLLVAGCGGNFSTGAFSTGAAVRGDRPVGDAAAAESGQRPIARPAPVPGPLTTSVPKPSQSAQTAEQFDTTTDAQRAEAAQGAASAGEQRKLGATVGALGNPAEPGFWVKTALVSVKAKGRVEYSETGKSVAVDLLPIEGPKTAGSRVSLAAMRLLGAPLTGLPDLIVYTE